MYVTTACILYMRLFFICVARHKYFCHICEHNRDICSTGSVAILDQATSSVRVHHCYPCRVLDSASLGRHLPQSSASRSTKDGTAVSASIDAASSASPNGRPPPVRPGISGLRSSYTIFLATDLGSRPSCNSAAAPPQRSKRLEGV